MSRTDALKLLYILIGKWKCVCFNWIARIKLFCRGCVSLNTQRTGCVFIQFIYRCRFAMLVHTTKCINLQIKALNLVCVRCKWWQIFLLFFKEKHLKLKKAFVHSVYVMFSLFLSGFISKRFDSSGFSVVLLSLLSVTLQSLCAVQCYLICGITCSYLILTDGVFWI